MCHFHRSSFFPMTPETIPTIKSWLRSYTDSFVATSDNSENLLHLKWVHSLKVAEHCRAIAGELGWSAHAVLVAEVVGLLHDAGRFPQFARYRTFVDAISVDHGECGAEAVRESDVLAPFSARDREIILESILYHNRRDIPSEAAEDALPFARLIRDADKLDIYRIIIERLRSGQFRQHLRTALGIEDEGPATPGAVEDILANRTVGNEFIRTAADFSLMQISWVFDINYSPAVRIIRERGYIREIAQLLPPDPGSRTAKEYILEYLENGKAGANHR